MQIVDTKGQKGFDPKHRFKVIEENPLTNADRVRHMADEELAEWKVKDCPTGKEPTEACFYAEAGGDSTVCRLCWLEWLKQEVSEGGNK